MLEETRLRQLVRRGKGASSTSQTPPSNSLTDIFPPEKIEEIKKRELRRFKASQDKKWRRWLDSVLR